MPQMRMGMGGMRGGRGGMMMGRNMLPPEITIHLVQKPTKAHQTKMEEKLRYMKRMGFELLQAFKKETRENIIDITE